MIFLQMHQIQHNLRWSDTKGGNTKYEGVSKMSVKSM